MIGMHILNIMYTFIIILCISSNKSTIIFIFDRNCTKIYLWCTVDGNEIGSRFLYNINTSPHTDIDMHIYLKTLLQSMK